MIQCNAHVTALLESYLKPFLCSVLGSILFIAQQPPGSFLVGGLLWLFGSFVQLISFYVQAMTNYAVNVPVLPYLLASNVLPTSQTATTTTTTTAPVATV